MAEHQNTLLQLQEIFQHSRINVSAYFRIVGNIKFNNVDCDEVYPNLFVGNDCSAENKEYLKIIGITHILNVAEDDVDIDVSFYQNQKIKYLGFGLTDNPNTKIDSHFAIISNFIENGLNEGGKVLVHCYMGFSRSATCAIAYLMICEGMSAFKACQMVQSKRMCRPNDGFLQQLVDLDNQLSKT